MAAPKVHLKASGFLLVIVGVLHYLVNEHVKPLSYLWLSGWGMTFGVLIDFDHIPFAKVGKAWLAGGLTEVKEKILKDAGWLDPQHVDFLHTHQAAAVIIILSTVMWFNRMEWWFVPVLFFGLHMGIDSFSRSPMQYPGTNPLGEFFGRIISKTWLKRFMYDTAGVPVPREH